MLNSTNAVVKALQEAKQVLFVVHEYLPLPLALWVPSIVSMLKDQGKDVTVLVSQDVIGWPKKIDEVYPTDMVLALEQLRQVISVPITSKSENIGDISYAITPGKLEITVVPVKETLDLRDVQTVTHGKTYDVVVGVGVSASHPVLSVMQRNQASLSRAQGYFLGTFALQATIAQNLPFLSSITVIDSNEDLFIKEVLQSVSLGKVLNSQQRELVTLFMQSTAAAAHRYEYLDKEGYEYLSKITDGTMDQMRMASIYTGDLDVQNRILQNILSSARKSTNNEVLLFGITSNMVRELGTTMQDIVTVLYYLPKYPQVKQVIVAIEENERRHHVYMSGTPESVKQVATKYGFPRTERLTGGVVEEIIFDKLCRDISRVAGKEELVPAKAVVYKEEPIIAPIQTAPERVIPPEHASIPVSQGLPQFVPVPVPPVVVEPEQVYEPVIPVEVVPEPIVEVPAPVYAPIPAPAPVATPAPQVFQPAQKVVEVPEVVTPVKTSSGLDFAAIAKKMRESIT